MRKISSQVAKGPILDQVEYLTHVDHINRWTNAILWLWLLVVIGSCVKQRYAVDYTLNTRALGAEKQENELKFPPPAAIELLTEVKTVAFAPPDECIEASDGKDIARQRCGEVMTALEQAASESGLQVVSWQAFRGSEPALNYARRNSVDILFEINRLGSDNSLNDYVHIGSLNFFSVQTNGTRQPWPVSIDVKNRCQQNLLHNASERASESSVVLDVNMISVRTGFVLWNYRRLYRSFSKAADSKGTNYFEGTELPESIICINSFKINDVDDTMEHTNAMSDYWKFQLTVKGRESSSEILRRVGRLAASEFIELLVYMQAVSPNEKRVTLRAPSRPKEAQGQVSLGCATVAAWLRRGDIKTPSLEYSRNCPKL